MPTAPTILFRELHNAETRHAVQLKFLAEKSLAVTNVPNGEQSTVSVDENGRAEFQIERPADFRLLRYEVR